MHTPPVEGGPLRLEARGREGTDVPFWHLSELAQGDSSRGSLIWFIMEADAGNFYNLTNFAAARNPQAVIRKAVGGHVAGRRGRSGREGREGDEEGPAWVGAFISGRSGCLLCGVGSPAGVLWRPPTPFHVVEFPAV